MDPLWVPDARVSDQLENVILNSDMPSPSIVPSAGKLPNAGIVCGISLLILDISRHGAGRIPFR